jgi:twitching motility protein PilT
MLELSQIFELASKKKASDVHLVVGLPPIIRVDAKLHQVKGEPPVTRDSAAKLIFRLLEPQQKERLVQEKELDISYQLKDETRFRVNCHYEKNNLGLVARIIPSVVPNLEDIDATSTIFNLARLDQGLILVTGPTGHGKSTTLAAMVDLINTEQSAHIVTLEDPIEFIFRPKKCIVRQRQLGTDMQSFAQGLKHILRQDPDVIMVGEMRDLETVAATITLAETGHLVLATLHTLNAAQTIDRIIDIFPPYQQAQVKLQLSMTLRGIVSQRLLPKSGGGRVAAREILINNPAVANMIRESKISQIKTAIQTSADEGMVTMDNALLKLYKDRMLDPAVAEAYISDASLLKKL